MVKPTRPDSLFWIELIEDTRNKRSLILKLAVPIVLVLPLTMKGVPETFRLAALPLIALFLGVLGSSVGLTRLKERGILERLSALPVGRGSMMRGYLLANAAMDGVQMLVPGTIAIASFGLAPEATALTATALASSILLANALGALVSTAAGGSGEVHLFSAICVLGIAGLSGLFSGMTGSSMDITSGALPFGLVADGWKSVV